MECLRHSFDFDETTISFSVDTCPMCEAETLRTKVTELEAEVGGWKDIAESNSKANSEACKMIHASKGSEHAYINGLHEELKKVEAKAEAMQKRIDFFERDVMAGKGSLCEMSDDACLDVVNALKALKEDMAFTPKYGYNHETTEASAGREDMSIKAIKEDTDK